MDWVNSITTEIATGEIVIEELEEELEDEYDEARDEEL